MARAMKCDICGKLYELYNTKGSDCVNSLWLMQMTKRASNEGFGYFTQKQYDCCPECMNDIRTYIGILGARKS